MRKGINMKTEIRIEGKIIVIEAEGAVSVRISEDIEVRDAAPRPAVQPPAPAAVPVPIAVAAVSAPVAEDSGLFARLVDLRRELAVSAKVPPYVVFKDVTLREMAEKLPVDLAAFSHISGVGQAKLEKYGAAFLAVINEEVAA